MAGDGGGQVSPRPVSSFADAEQRGNTLQNCQDFYLKAKARIWPWPSYMCQIRSTAAGPVGTRVCGPRHTAECDPSIKIQLA